MQALTPARRLDVVITSDHGFAQHTEGVNITQALIAAGLKSSATSTDVIVASQGQSVLFYVSSHEPDAVARLVQFLQQQPSIGVVFTRGGRGGSGSVPGTLSLDVTQGSHASRSPDVAASFNWTANRNPHGVPGAQTINSAKTGPLSGAASGHGGLEPMGGPQHADSVGQRLQDAGAGRSTGVTRRSDADRTEAARARAGSLRRRVRPRPRRVPPRIARSPTDGGAPHT